MVALYRCYVCCAFYLISSLAFSDVAVFPNTNTIQTSNGSARLVGVTSINSSSKSANVVIDARDRFGNPVRAFKTANFNTAKLKSYVTTCIRNPAACAASTALTSALVYYGYTLASDGRITLPANAGSFPECVEKPAEDIYGGVSTSFGPIPCAIGPNYADKYVLYTFEPAPQFPDLPMNGDLPSGVVRLHGMTYTGSSLAEPKTYYQNWYDTQPENNSTDQEVSEEEIADMALENPANLQIASGVYADVFDPVDLPETSSDSDFGTEPEPDPENDPNSEYEDMVGMEQVPEQTIDVSSYFDWGTGWLPKQCPAPKVEDFYGQSFSFEYDLICSYISDYLAPVMRVFAVFLFLGIVIGGVRD